jgi:hypothetical protein
MKQSTGRRKQTVVVWIGLVLLIASWLYPPWVQAPGYERHTLPSGRSFELTITPHHVDGFYCIFDPWNTSMRLDWMRLLVVDLIVVAIIGGLLFTFRSDK